VKDVPAGVLCVPFGQHPEVGGAPFVGCQLPHAAVGGGFVVQLYPAVFGHVVSFVWCTSQRARRSVSIPFKIYTYLWTAIVFVRSAYPPQGSDTQALIHNFLERSAHILAVCVCIACCFPPADAGLSGYSTLMPRLYGTPSRTGSDHTSKSGAARCAHTPLFGLIPAVLLLLVAAAA
jgi:hypothetical protein